MDQFLNPVYIINLIKNYYIETNRIYKLSKKDIKYEIALQKRNFGS